MTDSEDRNTVDPPSFHPSPRKISEGSPAQADSGLSAGNPADGADGSRQPLHRLHPAAALPDVYPAAPLKAYRLTAYNRTLLHRTGSPGASAALHPAAMSYLQRSRRHPLPLTGSYRTAVTWVRPEPRGQVPAPVPDRVSTERLHQDPRHGNPAGSGK